MGRTKVELLYGKKKLSLNLQNASNWKELNINKFKPLDNPAEDIKKALSSPIGAPALKDIVSPGETICLLVNDSTRVAGSEFFLPYLMEELTTVGVRLDDIFVMFTNGAHRKLSRKEMTSLVGNKIASKVKLLNHDCNEPDEIVFMGNTSRSTPVYINKKVVEADRRILTGSIVYHFFAGFGGGRKAIVPGVAGWDTIKHNHSLMLDPMAKSGVLSGNPVHEDLTEAANLLGSDFLFNVVLDDKKKFLGVFAGDMIQAHLKGCEFVRSVYGIAIEELADIVIVSCGGHPKDINLYQAQKTLDNAAHSVKPGGDIILLAECPEGTGSSTYEEWACKYRDIKAMEDELKKNFQLGGHKAYAVVNALRKCKVHLVSEIEPNLAKKLGFMPAPSLQEALARVSPGKDDLIYVIPQGSLTVPNFVK